MINHILVPLDNSPLAECVLPHVVAIAQALHARLTLLHILENHQPDHESVTVDPVEWHLRKQKSEKYLEDLAHSLQDTELTIDHVVLEGPAAESIIEFARTHTVDLIALSTHGSSGVSAWNISSVVQKILMRSYKSILLIRAYHQKSADPIHYKRMFVGLDLSNRAEYVLPLAMRLAQVHHSQLVLGTVIQSPRISHRFPLSEPESQLIDQILEKNSQAASHYFDQLVSQFSLNEVELDKEIIVGRNSVVALHDTVEKTEADLVLLVAHGDSGERRWPYGSVANSFIYYGNTPLIVLQDLHEGEFQPTHAESAMKVGQGH